MRRSQQIFDRPKTFEEELREARKRTECLINVRERSSKELEDRLKRAGFTDFVVESEVKAAALAGLVDDQRFRRLYVDGKKRSGWGEKRIEAGLKRFGIELKHCEGYPERFFSRDEEMQRAKECLERFRSSAKDQWAARYRHLISRGFSLEIVKEVLRIKAF